MYLVGHGIGEEWIKRPGRKNKRKKPFLGTERRKEDIIKLEL